MLVDLRPFGVTGKVAQEALDRAGITCNKNAIPNDPEKPFVTSGLRLGTAAVTTAGMGEPRDARDRGADRPRCCARPTTTRVARRRPRRRPTASARKFTPYPDARRRPVSAQPMGGYAVVFAVALGRRRSLLTPIVRLARDPDRRGRRRRPTRGTCTRSRRRRSAARRCSSASSSRWRSRRRCAQFHEMFARQLRAGRPDARRGRDVRRRRARRPPRRVAAGQDRRAGARGEPARRCSASRCSTSGCRSTCSTPTSSCCRPTSRRSSPCCGSC